MRLLAWLILPLLAILAGVAFYTSGDSSSAASAPAEAPAPADSSDQALAAASAQSTVQGTIAFDGRSVPMTHIYARQTRGRDNEPGQIKILIADRAAPADIAASEMAYIRAARAGQVQGLVLRLESAEERRLVMFAEGGNYMDTTVPSPFEPVELTEFVREGDWVSGRLRTTEPLELRLDGPDGGPTNAAIDLRFRARIAPAPRPTEELSGDAARRSPQAAAATRLLTLFRTGTPAQIRAALDPSHPAWEAMGSDQAAEMIAVAREALPTPTAFAQGVERVTVYGDEAVVVARRPDGRTTVSLRRVGGEWKAAQDSIPND